MTWTTVIGVTCVECPVCAFTFDADHVTVSTGEYDCPVCRQSKLETALREIEGVHVCREFQCDTCDIIGHALDARAID
jgi:predicted SprT family Zn-dependent metalloprotease